MLQIIDRLTPTELKVLEALANFQYLTAGQMMRLGVSGSQRHLYQTLRDMSRRRRAAVGRLDFGALPTIGRLAIVYHLTPIGAETLISDEMPESSIRCPKRVRLFHRDYFHRLASIDVHIAIHQWAQQGGITLDFFKTYFERGEGAGFGASTTLHWPGGKLTADAIFQFTTPDGATRLCAMELHRGKDIGRLERQLLQWAEASEAAAMEEANQYDQAGRILVILQQPDALNGILRRGPTLSFEQNIANRFFIGTLDQFTHDPRRGWCKLDGLGPVDLY